MTANSLTRICFTEAEDDLLAKGWPHAARLVDDHPHDKSPAKSALAWLGAIDPKYYAEWPRQVAYRVMHAGPIVNRESKQPALAKDAPPSKDEARAKLVDVVATFADHTYGFKVHDFVWLIETQIGADATLEAIVEGFEKAKLEIVKPGSGTPFECYTRMHMAETIGFLLLRTKKNGALRKRLDAQHARVAETAKKANDWEWCGQCFDVSLNGAAAYKRLLASGWRIDLSRLDYSNDDPDFVRECVKKEPKQPITVRLAKLGGTEVLANLGKRRLVASAVASAIRDFGMVRAPEVVDFVLSLVGKSSAKDAPMKWFEDHAEYARPIVAKSKLPAAKAVLARM